MSDRESFIDNLLRRRVLQFVGMYIAATWLVIELGDWVTERFGLPGGLTSYVFLGMLVLLPAVIVFAYGHGAPGKDRWTRFEKAFIPLNIAAAVVLLYVVDPAFEVEAATQTIQIADETGQVREFEVPRQGYHREVLGFFWTNASGEPDLDWLSYGLPVMLAHDIDRVSPVITVATPFNSESLRDYLDRHTSPADIPRSLAVQIARDRRSAALIVGSYDVDGSNYLLSARLIAADTGEMIGEHEIETGDWLDGVDRMTAAMLDLLQVRPADDKNDDPIRQHFSDSLEAIRHFSEAEYTIAFDNDYSAGIAGYRKAVEIDPRFAEARGSLSIGYYLSGDVESARTEAGLALRDGYRLSDASKFALKAQRYVYDGDFERGRRVLDIWTEVQPTSTRAFLNQAQLLRIQGGQRALDKAQAAYDRLLDLNPANIGVYLAKAEVEQQRGDFSAAAAYLQQYLELDPDSGEARLSLASVYQADGQLDRAQEVLEYAAVLLDDPITPGLALARLQARRGEYALALEQLDALLAAAQVPQQRLDILTTRVNTLSAAGRIRDALETHDKVSELARDLVAPMLRLFTIENKKAGLLALVGRTDEAVAIADEITAVLQPPQSHYMNFTYTGIYRNANDREAFRLWAEKSIALQDEFPQPMRPFISIEQAQLAAWDGRFDAALKLCDDASERVTDSFIQLIESDLSVLGVSVGIAQLYLDAGDPGKARGELEKVLKVYPGNAHAKLVLAKTLVAEDDKAEARRLVNDAAAAYADADEDYIYFAQVRDLLEELGSTPDT